MIAILVDSSGVESSQTIDEAGLMDDLRSSPALSGRAGFNGFDDPGGVEEGSGGIGSG